jgi:hypothetical protein
MLRHRQRRARGAKLLAALAFVVSTAVALAAPASPTRVVLLRPTPETAQVREAINRARAELRAEGFEVLVRDAPDDGRDPREALQRAAVRDQAVAALSVFSSANGTAADLWVNDRLSNKTVIRHVDVRDVPAPQRPNTLAIRVVELLRASMVEAASSEEGVPDDVARFVEPAGAPLRGFGMQLGVAMLASVDGLGIAGAPAARIFYGAEMGLAGRLSVVGPAFGARADGALGSASIRQERLMLELVYAPEVDWAGFTPELWIGAGGYHMFARGELTAPEVGGSDEVWAFAAGVGGGLGYRLTNDVAILLDAELLFTAPRAIVAMRGTPIGSAGQPSVVGTLGVAARF